MPGGLNGGTSASSAPCKLVVAQPGRIEGGVKWASRGVGVGARAWEWVRGRGRWRGHGRVGAWRSWVVEYWGRPLTKLSLRHGPNGRKPTSLTEPQMGQLRSFKPEKVGSVPADLAEPRLGPRPSPNCQDSSRHSDTPSLFSLAGDSLVGRTTTSPLRSLIDWTPQRLPCSSLVNHHLRLEVFSSGSHVRTPLPVPCRQLKLSVESPSPQPAAG